MEFLLTDGETFIHEEKRDLKRKFEFIDPDALAVRLTNSDPLGRYSLVKDILADPHHPVVLMRVRLEGDEELLFRMKAYALLAPHLEIGGAGNSGAMLDVAGRRVLLAWKKQVSLAMAADCGFSRTSCGFVGHSDGWQDLMNNFRMDWEFGNALNGNIALTGEIDLSLHREFVIAIGLGEGHHAALTSALGVLTTPFDQILERFIEQWHRAATPIGLKPASQDDGRLLEISHNLLLSHEDKQFPGAFIASASIPWGQHKGDDDLGVITWFGRVTWCRALQPSWPAGALKRHGVALPILLARSGRMAASRKTSGSMAHPIGAGCNSMRSPFPSFSRGASGK
jgi:glucoamylase